MQTAIHNPPNWVDRFNWPEVFGTAQPVVVDLGCGKGNFLLWLAGANPGMNYLGVDRLLIRLRKVDKKIQRAQLKNVRLLRIEASYLVTRLIPDSSICAYFIFFPDPWPKRRHHSRRLINPGFVAELNRSLEPGGEINIATDHEDYFRHIENVMETAGSFEDLPPLTFPEDARTEFETEFLKAGHSVYRMRWRKISAKSG